MDNHDFLQKIHRVNEILRDGGRDVIQKKETGHVQDKKGDVGSKAF